MFFSLEIKFDLDAIVILLDDKYIDKMLVDEAIDNEILGPLGPNQRAKLLEDFKAGQRWAIDTYGKPLLKYLSHEKRSMFAFRFFVK